ncbi:MAG: hypothetical protein JXB39_01145 [Deltaproteobacteria bacterium]|nr:hypothetical protein [Deltaproteobacteria bacterium]
MRPPSRRSLGRSAWLPAILLVLGFALVALRPLARTDLSGVYDDTDERRFHYPTVQGFLFDTEPVRSLWDTCSSTTPLYHLLLAGAGRILGIEPLEAPRTCAELKTLPIDRLPQAPPGMRSVHLGVSLGAVLLALMLLARRGRPWQALLLAAIPAASIYFLGPAVRLSTDNLALFLVFAVLWVLDGSTPPSPRRILVAAGLAALAVLTRQVHLWLAGWLLLVPWWENGASEGPGRRRFWIRALLALLPVVALVPFGVAWGHLVGPAFFERHASALNNRVFAYVLALVGLYAPFFLPWLIAAVRERPAGRGRWPTWIFGILVGLSAASFLHAPLYRVTHGRVSLEGAIRWVGVSPGPDPWCADPGIGGPHGCDPTFQGGTLWRLSGWVDGLVGWMPWGNATLFFPLVLAGCVVVYVLARDAVARRDAGPLLALLLWMGANLPSERCYQKYYEPFVLFLLVWFVARRSTERRWWLAFPAALLVVQLTLAIHRFYL